MARGPPYRAIPARGNGFAPDEVPMTIKRLRSTAPHERAGGRAPRDIEIEAPIRRSPTHWDFRPAQYRMYLAGNQTTIRRSTTTPPAKIRSPPSSERKELPQISTAQRSRTFRCSMTDGIFFELSHASRAGSDNQIPQSNASGQKPKTIGSPPPYHGATYHRRHELCSPRHCPSQNINA